MDKLIFNIDSRFRNINQFPDSEFFSVELNEIQKNIDFIRLTSIEIPYVSYAFTDERKNNYFNMSVTDLSGNITTSTIRIQPNYYNNTSICTAINNEIVTLFPFGTITFETSDISNISINISGATNGNKYKFDFYNDSSDYQSLGYQLGFREKEYTIVYNSSGSNIIPAEAMCDTNIDTYCFIRLNNYGNITINPLINDSIKALYKITFDVDKKKLSFENGSDFINKTYFFRQPVNIKRLEFELLDFNGNRYNNRGIDYSITVEMGQIYKEIEYNKRLNSLFS